MFLKAFPLSLSIFWRMAIVLPFMMIGLTLYILLGGLLGFLLGFLLPSFAFLLTFLIVFSSVAVPTLLGTRTGLQTLGVQPSTGIKGLFVPAIIYGTVEGASMTVILGLVSVFSLVAISPDILLQNEIAGLASQYVGTSGALPGVLVMLSIFLSACSIRASLLVPIASASIGRDPDGLPYTPFRHFRAAFGPLFALTVFSYIGMFILHAVLIVLMFVSGFAETLQADLIEFSSMTEGSAPIRPIWSLVGLFVIYLLIGTWSFSLQCAGGVLGYLHLRDSGPTISQMVEANMKSAKQDAAQSEPRMSADDLRALRKSRQLGTH